MPCYVNPDVALHERELCEQKWKFFQIVAAAEKAGISWDTETFTLIAKERQEYIEHRKGDRDFLIQFLEKKQFSEANESLKNYIRALTDEELLLSYWGTWEDQQLSDGIYRGQILSADAHPPSPGPHLVI